MHRVILAGAEVIGASALAFLASIVVFAYFLDRAGFTIAPFAVLASSTVVAVSVFSGLRRRARWDPAETTAYSAVVLTVLGWLLWIARPWELPQGGGPDLTHHLLLIDFIERQWRLVHDARVEIFLGEMVHYTPGSHLLAALVGSWMKTDGLHAVHPLVSLTIALKAGFVFLIALRTLRRGGTTSDLQCETSDVRLHMSDFRVPFAIAAVLLMFLPASHALGSFLHDSFVSQVVAELFVVGMWWALVVWDEAPSAALMALAAIAGAAAFLTWPVFAGPPLLVVPILVFMREGISVRSRLVHIAAAIGPIAAVAAIYIAGRAAWILIVRTSGAVLRPTPHAAGWLFPLLSGAGVLMAIRQRRARATIVLLGAIAVQAAALFALAKADGADTPYMALKMAYLAVYPLAVAGAIGMGTTLPRSSSDARLKWRATYAWATTGILTAAVVHQVARLPGSRRVISEPLVLASQWARAHVDPGCVDYLVGDEDTAYWLHLAALGNRRMSARTGDNNTFDPHKALVRWVFPDGLRFAIAEDFEALPRDVRDNVDVLARFPPAAVVKRHGRGACP